MQNKTAAPTCAPPLQLERPLRFFSLYHLVEQIVNGRTSQALEELLSHRPVFRFDGKKDLLLPDYLFAAWAYWTEHARTRTTLLWDRARDLTLDKFTSLPIRNGRRVQQRAPGDNAGLRKRVDCRNYYVSLLDAIESDEGFSAASGLLERDHLAAVCFHRFANHHFYMSYLEARRRENPFISRYTWRVDGKGKITIWMPKYLSGRKRGAWLKKHVQNPDPKQSGERERIQTIVNERLVIPRFVAFEPHRDTKQPGRLPAPDVEASARMRPSIADFLAREKAVSADLQRPSIRKLGPEIIEQLVKAVMLNLRTRERTDEEIAAEFGLSKTAYSHFAGRGRDKAKSAGAKTVADLWRNLAELLSQVDVFREVAVDAGVWRAVETVVNNAKPARLRGENDDQ